MSHARNFWDERETIFLIETCIKVDFINLLDKAVTRNEHLYEILAKHFQKAGFNRTNSQIRTKLKNLKQLYRNAKLTNTKYRFDYYDLMDKLFSTVTNFQHSTYEDDQKNTLSISITKNNQDEDDIDEYEEPFVDVIKNNTIDCNELIDYDLVDYNYESSTILNDICTDIENFNDNTTEYLPEINDDSGNEDENVEDDKATTNSTNDVHVTEITTDLIQTSLRNVSNGNIWTQYEIKALLDLLIEENFMDTFRKSRRTEQLFKNISLKFLTEKGFHRSFEQIRNKFRKLKFTYNKFQNNITNPNNDSENKTVPLYYKDRFIKLFSKFKGKNIAFFNEDDNAADDSDDKQDNYNNDHKKNYWTKNEIKHFIKIIIDMNCINELFLKGKIGKPVNHRKIYESIALKHNENGFYYRNCQQLQSKLRKLNEEFIRVSADESLLSACPYFNLLKQLLQNDQKVENEKGLDTLGKTKLYNFII